MSEANLTVSSVVFALSALYMIAIAVIYSVHREGKGSRWRALVHCLTTTKGASTPILRVLLTDHEYMQYLRYLYEKYGETYTGFLTKVRDEADQVSPLRLHAATSDFKTFRE